MDREMALKEDFARPGIAAVEFHPVVDIRRAVAAR
jgi:hypothetical protein